MRAVVNSDWYNEAVKIIANLIGPDVDCMLSVKGSKVSIEASNAEAWIKVPLQVEEIEGEGRLFTKVEYLSALKAKGSITLVYEEGSDHIRALSHWYMKRARITSVLIWAALVERFE